MPDPYPVASVRSVGTRLLKTRTPGSNNDIADARSLHLTGHLRNIADRYCPGGRQRDSPVVQMADNRQGCIAKISVTERHRPQAHRAIVVKRHDTQPMRMRTRTNRNECNQCQERDAYKRQRPSAFMATVTLFIHICCICLKRIAHTARHRSNSNVANSSSFSSSDLKGVFDCLYAVIWEAKRQSSSSL